MKTKMTFVPKLLALILALLLLFSAFPVAAEEAGEEYVPESETEAIVSETEQVTEEEIPAVTDEDDPEPADEELPTEESTEADSAEAEEPTVGKEDSDVAAVAATEAEPTEAPAGLADGYYLIGQKGWSVSDLSDDQLFVENKGADAKEYWLKTKLSQGQTIKVAYVKDGTINDDNGWFPPEFGNTYEVDEYHEGNVVVYFRPGRSDSDEWAEFGGYMFIPKTKKENEDDPEPEVIEDDTEKPTLSIEGYAYGENIEWNNGSWVNGDEPVNVILKATDEGWGVNANKFKKNGVKVKVDDKGGDKYYSELSNKNKIKTAPATFTVDDIAGNTSDSVTTAELKIDNAAPAADDIVKGVFSAPDNSPIEDILNALSFGLYTKKQIVFTLYVSNNGGSPITQIDVVDENSSALTKDGGVTYDETAGAYKQRFFIDPKDENDVKPYQLKVTTIKDCCRETNVNVDVLSLALYADTKDLKDRNKNLYEIVNTVIKPNSEITLSGGNKQNDIYSSESAALTFSAAVSDVVSGIAETDGVKVYVGKQNALVAGEDGTYDVTASGVSELDFTVSNPVHGSLREETGKLLSEIVSGTIPADKTAATGEYRMVTVVTSNSKNVGYEALDFTVDNDTPVLTDAKVLYTDDSNVDHELTDWTNKPVKIRFKAVDDADAFGMGVKADTITVTGSVTGSVDAAGNAFVVSPVDGMDAYYSVAVDLYQDYTIVVRDDYGHTDTVTVGEDEVLYDVDPPKITNLQYDGKSYAASPWQKKEDGVKVSFTVTDFCAKREGVWLSGKEGITVKVTGDKDSADYSSAVTISSFDPAGYTCEFVSNTYQSYSIVVTDHAGNDSKEEITEKTKVDSAPPTVTNISFAAEPANGGASILNFLTFGLYSDDVITMTVTVADEAVSSGIKSIVAYDENGNPLIAKAQEGGLFADGAAVTASRKFLLDINNIYDGSNFTVRVVDNAEYDNGASGESLYALRDKVTAPITLGLDQYFEIVGSQTTATITETSLDYKNEGMDDLHAVVIDGKRWYPGDVIDSYHITDTTTKIHSVKVELNNATITSACEDGTGNVPNEYTHWNAEPSGDKISTLDISFDSSVALVADNLHRTSDDNTGKNDVKVTVVSNNGCDNSVSSTFYIDNTIPVIDSIVFDDDDAESPAGDHGVVRTTYGYYFKNAVDVTVNASDVGSGVNNIHLYGVAATAEYGTVDFTDTRIVTSDSATFTIPANFKGQIVAYAYDNVNNRSLDYNPDGVIVESENTHPNVSGAKITVNTSPVGTDQDGVNLFNGDVSVSFDVYDMYSGLKDVSYRIIDTNHPDPEFISVNAYNTPVNASYVEDWRIDNIQSNLAYRVSKTITVSAQEHNDNGVKIQLKGTDRAGFEIAMAEETISIDITNPIIKLEYDPVSPTATHNGENYFNVNRTATITITERNFNPDQINWAKFVALEGSLPAVVGVSNWSTSYAIDAGSAASGEQRGAIHTAQITFADDGKFEVDFDYTDLAGNAADKQFTPEKFYIDKTKPVMTVELQYSAAPRYSKNNMATIKIVEHNFDPDSAHFTYTPTATGPDYTGAGNAPSVGAWSTSGDTHTATINFPDEGKYSFKITFKDLATNAADDHNERDFYIDHTANKPEFENVVGQNAYDGLIAPSIIYNDNSFNAANYSFTLTRHAYDFEQMKQVTEVVKYASANTVTKNTATSLDNGAKVDYENFPNQEIADGIYTLQAEFTDLAGNKADNSITFSVNRFGSVFLLGSLETTKLVDREYTNEAPDVVIREISAIRHEGQNVSLSYNSSSKTLEEKSKQYKVTSPNTVGRWYEYLYNVFSDNFKNEGEYTVTVTSQYRMSGKEKDISNRTANTDGKVERNCPVSFVVDKTVPSVSISGVEDGKFYSEAEKTLQIICTDDNIDKDSLAVVLDGQTIDLEAYGATVDDELFGEIDIELPIAADGKETQHTIKVEVHDLAGNSADNAINAFTLSATFLTMFFHNTVALIISGAVLAALIALGVVLVLKKRKNNAAK